MFIFGNKPIKINVMKTKLFILMAALPIIVCGQEEQKNNSIVENTYDAYYHLRNDTSAILHDYTTPSPRIINAGIITDSMYTFKRGAGFSGKYLHVNDTFICIEYVRMGVEDEDLYVLNNDPAVEKVSDNIYLHKQDSAGLLTLHVVTPHCVRLDMGLPFLFYDHTVIAVERFPMGLEEIIKACKNELEKSKQK